MGWFSKLCALFGVSPVVVILILALISHGVTWQFAQDLAEQKAETATLKQDKKDLEAQRDELKKTIQIRDAALSNLYERVRHDNRKIEMANDEIAKLRADLEEPDTQCFSSRDTDRLRELFRAVRKPAEAPLPKPR